MAMGDNIRARNRIDYSQGRGENIYGNMNTFLGAQGQQFQGDYGRALDEDTGMRDAAFSGYQNFANTGGFSPADIAAMRARAVSPIRSAYASAKRDFNRLGTNLPGRATFMSRLAREGGQAASDATTNAEANIAQLRQQGRLAGIGGINQLYGTTPAMTALQSKNVLTNTGQNLDLTGMEFNRLQGIMGAQNQAATLAGKGQTALGNVLDVANTVRNMWRRPNG